MAEDVVGTESSAKPLQFSTWLRADSFSSTTTTRSSFNPFTLPPPSEQAIDLAIRLPLPPRDPSRRASRNLSYIGSYDMELTSDSIKSSKEPTQFPSTPLSSSKPPVYLSMPPSSSSIPSPASSSMSSPPSSPILQPLSPPPSSSRRRSFLGLDSTSGSSISDSSRSNTAYSHISTEAKAKSTELTSDLPLSTFAYLISRRNSTHQQLTSLSGSSIKSGSTQQRTSLSDDDDGNSTDNENSFPALPSLVSGSQPTMTHYQHPQSSSVSRSLSFAGRASPLNIDSTTTGPRARAYSSATSATINTAVSNGDLPPPPAASVTRVKTVNKQQLLMIKKKRLQQQQQAASPSSPTPPKLSLSSTSSAQPSGATANGAVNGFKHHNDTFDQHELTLAEMLLLCVWCEHGWLPPFIHTGITVCCLAQLITEKVVEIKAERRISTVHHVVSVIDETASTSSMVSKNLMLKSLLDLIAASPKKHSFRSWLERLAGPHRHHITLGVLQSLEKKRVMSKLPLNDILRIPRSEGKCAFFPFRLIRRDIQKKVRKHIEDFMVAGISMQMPVKEAVVMRALVQLRCVWYILQSIHRKERAEALGTLQTLKLMVQKFSMKTANSSFLNCLCTSWNVAGWHCTIIAPSSLDRVLCTSLMEKFVAPTDLLDKTRFRSKTITANDVWVNLDWMGDGWCASGWDSIGNPWASDFLSVWGVHGYALSGDWAGMPSHSHRSKHEDKPESNNSKDHQNSSSNNHDRHDEHKDEHKHKHKDENDDDFLPKKLSGFHFDGFD